MTTASKCITALCKKELTSLESDKAYIALKKRITSANRDMRALTLKPAAELTHQDLADARSIRARMADLMRSKTEIEGFNAVRLCKFEKCRRDMDDTLADLMRGCEVYGKHIRSCRATNKTPLADASNLSAAELQKVIDKMHLEIFAGWEKVIRSRAPPRALKGKAL